ncbi:MAG: hypothetical protein PHY09_11775 [Desulfuromonadaceae bacterium]|nr:hypothetical protein [Desulfuromonadaceae bacterium]MDD5105326.1 hypothetical protein [Desulfuromonadaceae bacterium]
MRVSVTIVAVCVFANVAAVSLASETTKNVAKTATGEDKQKVHSIINKRCTVCHSEAKIDAALTAGKDMNVILKEMEKRGAKLNSNEREVLGIFWKESKPIAK